MKKKPTILITGAAGFIGYHLSDALLRAGYRVLGVDSMTNYYDVRLKERRLANLRKHKRFTFKKCSILDPNLLRLMRRYRVREIYHLAAQPGVRYSVTHPESYGETNYLGTLAVFEAAREAGVRRVVYASSSTVYGKRSKRGAFSETDRIDAPLSVYGATKMANEALAHAYATLYSMDMIGIRFFTVYGPYGRPDLGLFIFTKQIFEGKPLRLFNKGKNRRAFTHIRDILPPLMKLIKKSPLVGARVYNLGGEKSVPVTTLVSYIEKAVGKKSTIAYLPAVPGDMPETIADTRKAARELGYRPRITLEKGVREFVAWYRENEPWLRRLKEPVL